MPTAIQRFSRSASERFARARGKAPFAPPADGTDPRGSIRRKVCLVGAPRVGKTSLLRRAVEGVFNDKYRSTVGVRIDKAVVKLGARSVICVTWDLRGEELARPVEWRFFEGMAGYLLVVDGCRPETFDVALFSVNRIERELGQVPYVLLINKADRLSSWRAPEGARQQLAERALATVATSALTGEGVEEAFQTIAGHFLDQADGQVAATG